MSAGMGYAKAIEQAVEHGKLTPLERIKLHVTSKRKTAFALEDLTEVVELAEIGARVMDDELFERTAICVDCSGKPRGDQQCQGCWYRERTIGEYRAALRGDGE